MAQEQISVQVEKSIYELLAAVASAIPAIKAAKAAGGGIPAEIAAGLGAAVQVVADIPSLAGDFAESKLAFVRGGIEGSLLIADALK